MEWTPEAEKAVKKVPFFVRKKVRSRVENEAAATGKPRVTLADVNATRKRYLTDMSAEITGYRLESCFGTGGCPNRAHLGDMLFEKIENLLKKEDLWGFLKSRVKGPLKFHHEFTVTMADCPNSCSQPQIRDVGIIAGVSPILTDASCTQCRICVDVCKEKAVALSEDMDRPDIDMTTCLLCGECIRNCPSGTLAEGKKGWRVLLGGKLGRHPQLARELPGLFYEDEVIDILTACLDFYRTRSENGERFVALLQPGDFDIFADRFSGDRKGLKT